MAGPFGGSDVDDLITGNYLQQPSPWSWAKDYSDNQNKQSALMQELAQRMLMQQYQEQGQMERHGSSLAMQEKLAKLHEAGATGRTQMQVDAKGADTDFETDREGNLIIPASNANSLMQNRRFAKNVDIGGTIRKGGKDYVVLVPKGKGPLGKPQVPAKPGSTGYAKPIDEE